MLIEQQQIPFLFARTSSVVCDVWLSKKNNVSSHSDCGVTGRRMEEKKNWQLKFDWTLAYKASVEELDKGQQWSAFQEFLEKLKFVKIFSENVIFQLKIDDNL